ncbi:MAG: hypothetical protein RLZZ618_2584 [Pseudomonadota bacterium]|jgi:acyl-CoA thioester hydrolase
MSTRPSPEPRNQYRRFEQLDTRLGDNDVYGHLNNVVYYALFDTAVNRYLIECGALDLDKSRVIGLVAETHCNFFSSVSFPQKIEVGLRVAHVGSSSVRYEIGLFAEGESLTAAKGHFVHVYVDRETRRPTRLTGALSEAVNELVLP